MIFIFILFNIVVSTALRRTRAIDNPLYFSALKTRDMIEVVKTEIMNWQAYHKCNFLSSFYIGRYDKTDLEMECIGESSIVIYKLQPSFNYSKQELIDINKVCKGLIAHLSSSKHQTLQKVLRTLREVIYLNVNDDVFHYVDKNVYVTKRLCNYGKLVDFHEKVYLNRTVFNILEKLFLSIKMNKLHGEALSFYFDSDEQRKLIEFLSSFNVKIMNNKNHTFHFAKALIGNVCHFMHQEKLEQHFVD